MIHDPWCPQYRGEPCDCYSILDYLRDKANRMRTAMIAAKTGACGLCGRWQEECRAAGNCANAIVAPFEETYWRERYEKATADVERELSKHIRRLRG